MQVLVEISGKQFIAEKGMTIKVPSQTGNEGDSLSLRSGNQEVSKPKIWNSNRNRKPQHQIWTTQNQIQVQRTSNPGLGQSHLKFEFESQNSNLISKIKSLKTLQFGPQNCVCFSKTYK